MTKVMLCDFLEKIDEAAGSRRVVLPQVCLFSCTAAIEMVIVM